MDHDITWVEVFADRPLGGNLLPVITGADDIDDAVMSSVARRFQQPETSFVQTATDGVSDYRHRIFMVTGEIPFAGHPSLGTAAVVAHREGRSTAHYVQQTRAGRQPLEVHIDGTSGRVALTQNTPEFGPTPDPEGILRALAIDPVSRRDELVPQLVSTGLPTLIVILDGVEAVATAKIDPGAMQAAFDEIGDERPSTVYVAAEAADGRWRARAFAPSIPNGEDAATGSAAGPLGAYLSRHLGIDVASIDQGIEMGSPSRLDVDTTDGITVSGGVRIVGAGRHEIPRITDGEDER